MDLPAPSWRDFSQRRASRRRGDLRLAGSRAAHGTTGRTRLAVAGRLTRLCRSSIRAPTEVARLPDDRRLRDRDHAHQPRFPQHLPQAACDGGRTAIVPTPSTRQFGDAPIGSGPWKFVSRVAPTTCSCSRATTITGVARRSPTHSGCGSFRRCSRRWPNTSPAGCRSWRFPAARPRDGRRRAERKLQRRTAIRAWYVAINTRRGALADVRVRQALNHAIDIPAILARVMHNRGTLATGSIPPGLEGYDSTRERYFYDPELARRLLKAPAMSTTCTSSSGVRRRAGEFRRIAPGDPG